MSVTVLSESSKRARKEHRCDYMGCTIGVGDIYSTAICGEPTTLSMSTIETDTGS